MVVSSESLEEEDDEDEEGRDSALRDLDLWLLLLLCDLRDLRDLLDLIEGEGSRRELASWREPPSSQSRMERGTSGGGMVMISVRRSMTCWGGSGGGRGGASIIYWVRPVAYISGGTSHVV